jgi:hypothetical protein
MTDEEMAEYQKELLEHSRKDKELQEKSLAVEQLRIDHAKASIDYLRWMREEYTVRAESAVILGGLLAKNAIDPWRRNTWEEYITIAVSMAKAIAEQTKKK